MAGEIVLPISLWPHRINNANAVYLAIPQTTNAHTPKGFKLGTSLAADLCGAIAVPIPPNIAGTPNGKIRLRWMTTSTDTSNATRLFVKVVDINPNSDSLDPSSWDDELQADDTSNGQYVENEVEVSISNAVLSAGRDVRVLIRRDKPGTAADALAADVFLLGAFLVADKAA